MWQCAEKYELGLASLCLRLPQRPDISLDISTNSLLVTFIYRGHVSVQWSGFHTFINIIKFG